MTIVFGVTTIISVSPQAVPFQMNLVSHAHSNGVILVPLLLGIPVQLIKHDPLWKKYPGRHSHSVGEIFLPVLFRTVSQLVLTVTVVVVTTVLEEPGIVEVVAETLFVPNTGGFKIGDVEIVVVRLT